MNIHDNLYYFDQNRRIYNMNGVKKNSPYHIGYFCPIKTISENTKEIVCEHGVINKKSKKYKIGRTCFNVYTEQQMLDEVFVEENRHVLSEKVRRLNATALREIKEVITKYEN